MFTISLIATTFVGMICLAMYCAVVVHDSATLQPVTVNPFLMPGRVDPSADTISSASTEPTLAGDWNKVEMYNLSEVEDLLDLLEAKNFKHREMDIIDNSTFVVRWR